MQKGASVTTPRLILRLIGEDDLEDVFATMNYRHTAEIISFLYWPMTMDQAQAVVTMALNGQGAGNDFMYLARSKVDGAIVGYVGCHRREGDAAEFGYWVCEPQQGKGYASEMAGAMVDLAFSVLSAGKVYATVAYGNIASARVLEKNGLTLAGEKGVALPDGTMRPSHLYERSR